jgi:PleD family two-component response regulator
VWKQVDVARGIAEYNPQEDETISDVVRRADRNMYENKWNTKEERR